MKEKIHEFQKKVEESYSSEARERFALKKEIERIVEANAVMTLETKNLTQALKGDVKSQGNWGEIVLERVLKASGLREGEEYVVQGKAMGLVDEEGKLQKPDVIINLPDEKHLIVDSKVSLVHYEQYISETSSEKKAGLLESFKQSIYNHINGLASKKYQHNEQLISPDFVMMFFPIEGALSLALQSDPELFLYAWNKSIVIVSPTTLLATLRTVASVWKQDRQTKNAM
ncbi:MAG: DNA recombination protein RmuC, partial [Nitrospirae bacterium]|nr:DNA recombination protein RmuC [Nitrospirota bacterium]